jgi:hypothetical protein
MKARSDARRRSAAEDGYILVAVMFMLTILVLSLAVAAPRIKQALERDREVEATHRGKQYVRAIQLYYHKFHAYPPNVDALVMTNNVRFLRKKYVDPITGKDDWAPIFFGQNKVPTVVGFFGQPIGMSSIAGTGPGSLGTGPGGAGNGSSLNNSSAGSADNTDPNSAPSNSSNNQTANGTTSGSTNGQTFGGAGIIGFSIPSEKQSILVLKKQNHFNQWEFVYDPLQESIASLSGGGATAPGGIPGASIPPTGNPSPGGGTPINSPWGPNGNLPSPGSGAPPNTPFGPNGNLPTPQPQQ